MKRKICLHLTILLVLLLIKPVMLTATNLYWVGGSGNWADPAKWSFVSGGTGGAGVPNQNDDVFFNSLSGFSGASNTVTLNVDAFCRDMNWTGVGSTPILAGTNTVSLVISGSVTFVAGMNITATSAVVFDGPVMGQTITMAGQSFKGTVTFASIIGGWILQDGFTTTSSITLASGLLNTNSKAVSATSFTSTGSAPRSLVLGSSVITLSSGSNSAWNTSTSTNLTMDAGTSEIIFNSNSSPGLNSSPDSVAFFKVTSSNGTGTFTIAGNNIFNGRVRVSQALSTSGTSQWKDSVIVLGTAAISNNNVFTGVVSVTGTATISTGSANSFRKLILLNNATVNSDNMYDTLVLTQARTYSFLTGTNQTIKAPNGRIIAQGTCTQLVTIRSVSNGTPHTFTKASDTISVDFVSLRDNQATGGAVWNVSNMTDLGGNSGWIQTVPVPRKLYWVGGSGNWNDTGRWSLTSGGPSGACPPTQVDSVFFNSASGSNPTVTINVNPALCGAMDWTGAINPVLAGSNFNTIRIFGSVNFITAMNITFTGNTTFDATTPGKTIKMSGQSFKGAVTFIGEGGGWTLQDSFTVTSSITHTRGMLNTNSQAVSATFFNSNNSNARGLTLGASVFTLSASINTAFNIGTSTNLTLNTGTSEIILTSATTPTFAGSPDTLVFNKITTSNAAGTLAISGNNRINGRVKVAGNLTANGNSLWMDSVTVSGNATINNKHNFQGITSVSGTTTVSANGGNTFRKLITLGNGIFSSPNIFDTLQLTPGRSYTFLAGDTQTFNSPNGMLIAQGSCSQLVTLSSSTAGTPAYFKKDADTISAGYVALTDIHATGGAVFRVSNLTDLGNNSGWTITPSPTRKLFWVGGTGNWNDMARWSLITGGTGGECIPTQSDTVIFDNNSFSAAGQTVTINANPALCGYMDWTGSNNPILAGTLNTLRIYGSVVFSSGMNITYSGPVIFDGSQTGKTIKMSGQSFKGPVSFAGNGGEWTLLEPFTVTSSITLTRGTLITDSYPVTATSFSSSNSNVRSLVLGSSVVSLSSSTANAWNTSTSSNLVFNSGNSVLTFTSATNPGLNTSADSLVFNMIVTTNPASNLTVAGTGVYKGKVSIAGSLNLTGNSIWQDSVLVGNAMTVSNSHTFNHFTRVNGIFSTTPGSSNNFSNLSLMNNGTFLGPNTFDTLQLSPSRTYIFAAGDTQTFNAPAGYLKASGTCTQLISLGSSSPGNQAMIRKTADTLSANNVSMQDISAVGGGVFQVSNLTDLGNNSGFTASLAPARNVFWVGGNGNWNDVSRWSLTSGGAGGACVPTQADSVFFDSLSFTGSGQIVTIDINPALCHTMNWTGANSPVMAGGSANTLRISGSLVFIPGMSVTHSGPVVFDATTMGNSITTAGNSLNGNLSFTGNGGEWALNDSLTTTGGITLTRGTLNSNSNAIAASTFNASGVNARTLNLGASVISLSGTTNTIWNTGTSSGLVLNSGNSEIIFTGTGTPGLTSSSDTLVYNRITATTAGATLSVIGNSTFKGIVRALGGISIAGNNTWQDSVIVTGAASISSNNDFLNPVVVTGTAVTTPGSSGNFKRLVLLGNGTISGTNSFETLQLTPARTYTFQSGATQTILASGSLIAKGAPGQQIELRSSTIGTQATLYKDSTEVCLDFVNIRDIAATGSAIWFAGNSSNNLGNNSGWTFSSCCGAPAPAIPTVSGNSCGPQTLTFNGVPPSGTTWYWQGTTCGTSTGLGSTSTYSAAVSGTYYLRSKDDTTGCWSVSCASVQVSVSPAPTVNFPTLPIFCTNNPDYNLNIATPAGGTYSGPGVNGNVFTPSVAGPGNHTLKYVYTNSFGCSDSATQLVAVLLAPAVPVITESGDTLFSSSANDNQWYLNGNIIPGATGQFYVPVQTGFYTVVVNQFGCVETSSQHYYEFTGIQNIAAIQSNLFPNPNTGVFRIETMLENGVMINLMLMELSGRKLWEVNMQVLGNRIDVSLPSGMAGKGMYMLKLQSDNKSGYHKLFITE
jgi:hypothetical protein